MDSHANSRTDRLDGLVRILRDGQLHRAADLARSLGVSDRTIWRDVATLRASGLAVQGERGVGYMLTTPVTLPPVALTQPEMEALRLGIALVASASDPVLAIAAHSLNQKIAAVSPGAGGEPAVDRFVFASPEAARAAPHLPVLRRAITEAETLDMTYRDLAGRQVDHRIRPLQLEYWGRFWTLIAWCENRNGFRNFRIDLVQSLRETGQSFEPEPGKTLADFRAAERPG